MVRYNDVSCAWFVRPGGVWVYYPDICTEVLACLTLDKWEIDVQVMKLDYE